MSSYGAVVPVEWRVFQAILAASTTNDEAWPGLCAATCARAAAPLHEGSGERSRACGDTFYGRLRGRSEVQVAGFKNRLRGLERWFEVRWSPDAGGYTHQPRPGADRLLIALLQRLFLSLRPGCVRTPHAWPSSDEDALLGYLSPGEARLLGRRLARSDRGADRADPHWELFLDRAQRAAAQGLGLASLNNAG